MLFMRSMFCTGFQLPSWTQRTVIAALFILSGCLDQLNPRPLSEHNRSVLQQIPDWGSISTEALPGSAGHLGEILALKQVSNAPAQVVSAGTDGNIIAWALQSGSGHLLKQIGGTMQLAAFGEDKMLVAWTSGASVRVACLATDCQGSWELTRLKTRFTTLAFHEDDSALLIGGADGRVYRWRFLIEPIAQTIRERDQSLERYVAHQTSVSVVQPLSTGRAFFSADWDGMLYGWLVYTADDHEGSFDKNLFGGRFFGNAGSYISAGRAADRGITSMAISHDGRRLALGSDDGFVEIWEVRGFQMIARAQAHSGRVISIALNDAGSRVVSVGRDGKIQASEVLANPSFGIAAQATMARLVPILSEEMKSARRVLFISSGNVLITTNAGQVGELSLGDRKAVPPPQTTPSTIHHQAGGDSDY
jgi:WD40 repeat protein